ncbi:NAD-dependent malic enzyme [Streptomyces sp. Amel2xE9]|uniref:NAD-dependent malic enzyme n=1 Tax=unclassified Streptomyces TaxID=2593676 RepID=UPI0003730B73|nr:NAD-dependent malic enzyme [Streptomyces sp. Amel2xE9]
MAGRIPDALSDPLRNRGTAFTLAERDRLGLTGRLPAAVETLDQQAARAHAQLDRQPTDLAKYIYLDALHDRNETLYFKLLVDHLPELLPVVYDPTVGEAIQQWSRDYRRSRAVYLSIDRPQDVRASFASLGLGPDDVDLVVVSDAQQILGIGDWGVNGTDISVGKLAVYTAAAGIHPERAIAVNLDVGTDNQLLLNDPMYLGNRHARVTGTAYDDFVALYLSTVAELFPHALLHFEDFGPSNARRILVGAAREYRIFNDDLQGTGAITLAAVLSALKVTGESFADQRLVVFGAGTAGTGIADQLAAAMVRAGLTAEQARSRVWLVDRDGLVTDDMKDLPEHQRPYARPAGETDDDGRNGADGRNGDDGPAGLLAVVRRVKPTILVGTSTVHGAFTREVVEALCAGVERPVLLPLSNPDSRMEVRPDQAIPWSGGKALMAVGVPVDPVVHDGTAYTIGQANNALLYPGLGLGCVVARAERVTDGMLLAAANAVAEQTDVSEPGAALLPPVRHLRASSAAVAVAVARAAAEDGVATRVPDNLVQAVQDAMWQPAYDGPAGGEG